MSGGMHEDILLTSDLEVYAARKEVYGGMHEDDHVHVNEFLKKGHV